MHAKIYLFPNLSALLSSVRVIKELAYFVIQLVLSLHIPVPLLSPLSNAVPLQV